MFPIPSCQNVLFDFQNDEEYYVHIGKYFKNLYAIDTNKEFYLAVAN